MCDVFLFLVTGALFKYTTLFVASRQHQRRATRQKVGTLSRIFVYPVKSMRGLDVQTGQCDFTGISTTERLRDRSIMICTKKGTFVTARHHPKLVLVVLTVDREFVYLDSPGMGTLKLRIDQQPSDLQQRLQATVHDESIDVLDYGDEAAEWISSYLGVQGLRVVYHTPTMTRRRCVDGSSSWHKNSKPTDQVSFQDGFPFMMISEGSLAELNSRLLDGKVADLTQFRPNLVVTGSTAFSEDEWDQLFIGTAVFTNIKPCDRCIMTTVSTVTGTKDPHMEPLRTLRSYRLIEPECEQSPCFGINLVIDQKGMVKVGDEIWAAIKS